jgi:Ca2+-binding RTX toxin-like protein
MAVTAAEQYLLELINRARLDPAAEAARFGISLNQGLAAGTIGTGVQQVLAFDSQLELSAQRHSDWMLATDTFSHTGAGGSTATERMRAAGFEFAGSWRSGENLAFSGTTGTINLQTAITQHYDGLFRSAGHRANTLNANFAEIGMAQVEGRFTQNNNTFNASILTENFARSGTEVFITGVAYRDTDNNRFYGIGEGRGDIWVAADAPRITTAAAGGYSTAVNTDATTEVSVGWGMTTLASLVLDMSHGNVKLDLVTSSTNQLSLDLSGSATLVSGINMVRLLGMGNLNLTGNAAANQLTGNSGANCLSDGGGGGADTLTGMAGNDSYVIRNAGTQIIEGAGQGTADRVYAALSFALAGDDYVEIMQTTCAAGTGGIDLTGNGLAQQIWGNAGANALRGGGGADQLTGGAGADRFVFTTMADSLAGTTSRDTIIDMQRGVDRIDLSRLDASILTSGIQDCHYIGTAGFSGAGAASAGQLRWGSTPGGVLVEADLNGDGHADMQIMLTGITALGQTDFIF